MADITRLGEIAMPKLSDNMAPEDRRSINNYLMQLRDQMIYMMQNPDEIPYVRRRLDMATVLVPELQSVLQAIFQCADSGQPLNLTTLQQLLDDKAFQQIALAMAQNHDAPLQHQDIDMYLDRLESARPLDEKVRQMDDSQFSDFFANMGKKKGAKAEEPEE